MFDALKAKLLAIGCELRQEEEDRVWFDFPDCVERRVQARNFGQVVRMLAGDDFLVFVDDHECFGCQIVLDESYRLDEVADAVMLDLGTPPTEEVRRQRAAEIAEKIRQHREKMGQGGHFEPKTLGPCTPSLAKKLEKQSKCPFCDEKGVDVCWSCQCCGVTLCGDCRSEVQGKLVCPKCANEE